MSTADKDFPSGKRFSRTLSDDGTLSSESHSHGLECMLTRYYRPGGLVEEMYIVNGRLVSRARYEKVRVNYPDMPAADMSLFDIAGELVKGANAEQRARRAAAKARQPDPAAAAENDVFCLEMMTTGKCADAVSWIASSKNNLGELSPAASRKLVAKFAELGCKQIIACSIDSYEDDQNNTGHLVIELPGDTENRKKVFRSLHYRAREQGLSGDFDDGQKYAYLKLD